MDSRIMNNKVYYGEYSLKHWIDLMLSGNITLPPYQRSFVWDKNRVEKLIQSLIKRQFIPPVTIGGFSKEEKKNLIIDGQQRLTSLLLAYRGLFPDKDKIDKFNDGYIDENDDQDQDIKEQRDKILKWNYNELLNGNFQEELYDSKIDYIPEWFYKIEEHKEKSKEEVKEYFFKNTYLGFSYIVPHTEDEKEQQKFYTSVFRHINVQGKTLLPEESRQSLYYYNKELEKFFDPDFVQSIKIGSGRMDFVRYLALLSEYKKKGRDTSIAQGYKGKMEEYYENYIFFIVGEKENAPFIDFENIKEYQVKIKTLESQFNDLSIPKNYQSIIDMDTYLFGLIYMVLFEDKVIITEKTDLLKTDISKKISQYKRDKKHQKSPANLGNLRRRIKDSINIYKKYLQNE
ncbi:GmrSD restriction endonuclease domain-containing protein [Capnocytophaga gingivalis]|uniref:GmrSD restriction endonuclease domain-containing protein n=1 Tax=Capnocytophaga gingivalis TaxID=1017 RepID=UPI0023F838C6|nr:DUF262 domain-containing protein [Capnocytophaga gingivalis]